MAKDLCVHLNQKPCYEIKLRMDFSELMDAINCISNGKKYGKICIVTDSEVAKIYLKEVVQLSENYFDKVISFEFANGESSKNIATVEKLYQSLINSHFDRGDLLLALGGGVVGDLCGFTAATYLRGIDFVQVPTTLLSQVDSSIGGKTGVDFMQYKNMVGAFYMPKLVYMNIATLHTLPEVQFQSGMAEVLKHGLIRDRTYFDWLFAHQQEICALKDDILEQMIYESCKIKRAVVEEDPKEQGIRAYLNFGHTIGHAVEKLSDFNMFHGQCVGVGMVAAAYLSSLKGGISGEEYQMIRKSIASFGLPISVTGLSGEEILSATKSDKKMSGSHIKFIILRSLGNAEIYRDFSDEELLEGISVIL